MLCIAHSFSMNRGTSANGSSSSHSRRSFPWLRRRSPSRSRRSRHRSIELNGSFKSIETAGANSSHTSDSKKKPERKIRRGRRRHGNNSNEKLAATPSIRPGLSTQKSWKDTFKIPRGRSSKYSDTTSKDIESETSSTHVSAQRKPAYVPANAGRERVERLPVSGPPRTILANTDKMVKGGLGESQVSLQLDDMLEPEHEQIDEEEEEDNSTIHDTDFASSMDRTPTGHKHQDSGSTTEIPTFLDETSLYSDTDQALNATRKNSPAKKQNRNPVDAVWRQSCRLNSSGASNAIPSLTISEGSSWLGSHLTTHLNEQSSWDTPRRQFVRENSVKSRQSAAISEATSLAESSAVYSTGYMSSAATSLENSSFSRPSGLLQEEDTTNSNSSLNLDTLEETGPARKGESNTDPETARRLEEIEREKEMLELAIQRSLNDSGSFQFQSHRASAQNTGRYPSRQCALYTPPNPLQTNEISKPTKKKSKSRKKRAPKPLSAFLQERISEDERAAELIAENELLELAMERSIAEASASEQGANHMSISSIYVDEAKAQPQPYASLLDPHESAQEDNDEWESWQERYHSSRPNNATLETNPQEVSESRTSSHRRPNIRSRSVEISDDEEGDTLLEREL